MALHPVPAVLAGVVALGFAAHASPSVQNARPPVRVDTTTTLGAAGAAPAASGEHALIVYNHDGEVAAVRSSDRGQSWSTPVRIDTDASGAFKWSGRNGDRLPVALFGTRAHVVWRDARLGADDLWYSRSTDGGVSFATEARIDPGFAPGTAPVRDFAFQAVPVTSADQIHLLFTLEPGFLGPDEVFLVSSLDGGLSFQPALPAASVAGGGIDVDQLSLCAEGSVLHCVWVDDRMGSDDVYYRRSDDAGLSFDASERRLDTSGPGLGDVQDALALAAEGALVAVAWLEELGSSLEQLHIAVSTDGGDTFAPDLLVGEYTPNQDDVDACSLAIEDGILHVAWVDDRSGVNEVHASFSTDEGVTWSPDALLSSGGGTAPRLESCPGLVALVWTGGGLDGVDEGAFARASRDGGTTWSPALALATSSGDVDLVEPALDAVYGNLVAAWLADDLAGAGENNVWAGGFRPQTQIPVGWVSGPTTARFDLSGFAGDDALVWVLGSDAPGSFVPGLGGDARDTGLTLDATLQYTLAYPSLFLGTLDSTGAGASPSFALNMPPGVRIYTMAISFSLAPLRLGELTDVILLAL